MKKAWLLFLLIAISACATPERVKKDYRSAQKNDDRAIEARERGDRQQAERYKKLADKQRDHSGLSILVGYIVGSIFSSSENEEQ